MLMGKDFSSQTDKKEQPHNFNPQATLWREKQVFFTNLFNEV